MTLNLTDARRQWLAELYEANSTAVFNLCRRLLNSREDAADATHEVFLRAAASLSEPPTSPQARGWLITVARNHCIDVLRRRERFGLALTTLGATADADEESVRAVEDRQLLFTVLQQLGVRDREALWQSAVEGRPVPEIARSFGLSYMATAQLLSRARRRALVLVTRLAVILGLAQLGRTARRSVARRAQQVAAVGIMPLLVAVVVGSSSAHRPLGAEASARAAGLLSLAPSTGYRSPGGSGPLPGTGPSTPPVATGAAAAAPVATVLGAQTTAAPPVPAPGGVIASPPVPSVIDVDHGKGRDRDDTVRNHPGHGKALGR